MTTIIKRDNLWSVKDIQLEINKMFYNLTDAEKLVDKCNIEKIRRMSGKDPIDINEEQYDGEVCETCGGSEEITTMESIYANDPSIMAPVGVRPCPDCRGQEEDNY